MADSKMMDLAARGSAIQRMGRGELRDLWRETFGEDPRSGNVAWMRKRLAWGVQAAVLGGLSEAAKQRIEELTPAALAMDALGIQVVPRAARAVSQVKREVLTPGTILTRAYKGRTIEVLVREDGRFEYDGVFYASLSAVAKAVTGSHWNGRLFFFGRNGKRESA